ncbi:MAG: hypothetical protein ACTHMT_15940 [Verrucomicrobiota bacterium]
MQTAQVNRKAINCLSRNFSSHGFFQRGQANKLDKEKQAQPIHFKGCCLEEAKYKIQLNAHQGFPETGFRTVEPCWPEIGLYTFLTLKKLCSIRGEVCPFSMKKALAPEKFYRSEQAIS